jgi:hypothetical protein
MSVQDELPRRGDPTEIEPRPRPLPGPVTNASQLKHAIDSGATGDKVAVFDPSSTPLGTDAEAAGSGMTPEMAHAAYEAERMNSPPPGDPGKSRSLPIGLLAFLASLALAGVIAAIVS